jgi:hypothetical protein
LKEQGVAEGAPIVVAQAPIHIRNPKKAPQPYRNQGDIVPDTKPPSTEKRGVKGRPGQRPMPKYDEGSSNAIANTASRLANKDDGKVAKLRAAGDKKRDSQYMGTQIAKNDRTSKDEWGNLKEKIKGADGKACWKGYRYNGTENGKDKCVPISEDVQDIMDVLINKIIVNEAIQNNNR